MINAILVEDEQHCIDRIKELISSPAGKNIQLTGIARSVEEARALIAAKSPDLVFLDVQLSDGSAFDLLHSLPVDFQIIFTTAFDSFAVQAFRFSAVDYLLKPVDETQFSNAVVRTDDILEKKSFSKKLDSLLANIQTQKTDQRICIPTKDAYEFVNVADIIYGRSEGNYTFLHLSGGKKMIASKPLKEFEKLLTDHGFYRVHHSYLINLLQIRRVVKTDGGYVEMSNGDQVEISVRKKDSFLQKIKAVKP
jgi:two-component system, LytTR family, response regulator